MKKYTFILLKRDQLVADSIGRALEEKEYTSWGCFTQADMAIAAALGQQPDFFLTETDLPGASGYDVIRQVKQLVKTDCIIRTTGQRRHIQDGVNTNVSGYLHAVESGMEELFLCLQTIRQGNRYISPAIDLPLSTRAVQEQSEPGSLSERERAVMHQLSKGTENELIAQLLFMSVHTLNTHLSHLKVKLNVSTTRELVVRSVYLKHMFTD